MFTFKKYFLQADYFKIFLNVEANILSDNFGYFNHTVIALRFLLAAVVIQAISQRLVTEDTPHKRNPVLN